MASAENDPPLHSPLATRHSPLSVLTAFWVLAVQSFQRHWRVRQMAWVSVGLLGAVVASVAVVTARGGWDLPGRPVTRGATHRQHADQLDLVRALPLGPGGLGAALAAVGPYQGLMRPEAGTAADPAFAFPKFLHDWSFASYSRWAVSGAFVGFLLPLFTLSYATAAFGAEREARSLVWVMTRPVPRAAIYLAKFVGTLPWCVAFGLGGFAAVCVAGGELGLRALEVYWPAAAAGTVVLSAVFHLFGAVFRRPVVVGLVYVFFFEALVAALPGSLKLLSLTFYVRSLMYNAAAAAGYPAEMLDVSQAEESGVAWAVLAAAAAGVTGLGMYLFARAEYRDDV
ncbi:MAG: hypothetical protein C0501_07555 [Isosphaera sp.]|nr:hypothetical protein [Isosphaera sp.]